MDPSSTPPTPDRTALLRKAGLTDSQARGYLALIENGALSPVELAEKTGESRTNGYMICDKLVALGLATKKDGAKSEYAPENPSRLKQILIDRQKSLRQANDELAAALPALVSTYKLVTDKPGVLYLEGIDSLVAVYDDIIATKDILRIFPSAYDRDDPEIEAMIDKQIARQRAVGIKTEVLLRKAVFDSSQNDELFEARPGAFDALDAQIMIYGPNVALTTFENGVITTVLTNQLIADTFRQLFAAQWDQSS